MSKNTIQKEATNMVAVLKDQGLPQDALSAIECLRHSGLLVGDPTPFMRSEQEKEEHAINVQALTGLVNLMTDLRQGAETLQCVMEVGVTPGDDPSIDAVAFDDDFVYDAAYTSVRIINMCLFSLSTILESAYGRPVDMTAKYELLDTMAKKARLVAAATLKGLNEPTENAGHPKPRVTLVYDYSVGGYRINVQPEVD